MANSLLAISLSRITDTDMTIRPHDKPEARKRLIHDWKYWWGPRRADYVTFSGASRIGAFFLETQYAKWLGRLLTFDFDRSSQDNVPIRKKLGARLKVTLTLALTSLFLAYIIAIPMGVFSAVRQYTLADRIITVVLFMLYSLPTFWVAMLLQQYMCGVDPGGLNWFPLVGLGVEPFTFGALFDPDTIGRIAWHMVLPIFVLTYRSFASLSRYQRVGMLEIIRQDFIRTARAKGLPERIVIAKHALRNSVLPIVTLLGIQLPFLVGGAVIVESIFQINGMGLETLNAIRGRDINWIMAAVTVTSLVTMAGMLLADILYAFVDPRIQMGNNPGERT
jgi:peptide/nickel transport system permease protein